MACKIFVFKNRRDDELSEANSQRRSYFSNVKSPESLESLEASREWSQVTSQLL